MSFSRFRNTFRIGFTLTTLIFVGPTARLKSKSEYIFWKYKNSVRCLSIFIYYQRKFYEVYY